MSRLTPLACNKCGAPLHAHPEGGYQCAYCGGRYLYEPEVVPPDVAHLQADLDSAKAKLDLPKVQEELEKAEASVEAATRARSQAVARWHGSQRMAMRTKTLVVTAAISGPLGLWGASQQPTNRLTAGDWVFTGIRSLEYARNTLSGLQFLHAAGFLLILVALFCLAAAMITNASRSKSVIDHPVAVAKAEEVARQWIAHRDNVKRQYDDLKRRIT